MQMITEMESVDGFTFEPICDKYTEEIRTKSTSRNQSNGDVIIRPPGCVQVHRFKKFLKKIQDFEIYPDDTWVVTFPKCGTTWTQEMVWLLINNLDFKQSRAEPIRTRFPFLELEAIMSKIEDETVYPHTIDLAANTPRPRCIKSHLPVKLLPKKLWTVKPKIIYVSRDPKDAVTSYYHHHRLWNGHTGTFEDFVDVFLADRVVYAPFWQHVVDFWQIRNEPNVLFNTYEEMKRNLKGVIEKTAKFLGVELTAEQINALRKHLSFESMRDNVSCNYMDIGDEIKKEMQKETDENLNFIRKGESGGWRKILSENMLQKFDEWNKKHLGKTEFSDYEDFLKHL